MGQQLERCALTQLPISDGERIVMFLIVEVGDEYYKSNCYGNLSHNLVPIPFFGKADGYHWIKMDDGQQHKLDYLNEKIIDVKDAKTQLTSAKLSTICTIGSEHRVTDFYGGGSFPIDAIFIREDAFNEMRSVAFKSEFPNYHGDVTEEYLISAIDDFRNVYEGKLRDIQATMDAAPKDSVEYRNAMSKLFIAEGSIDIQFFDYAENGLVEFRAKNNYQVQFSPYAPDYKLLVYYAGKFGQEFGYYTVRFLHDSHNILTRKEMIDVWSLQTMLEKLGKAFSVQGWASGEDGLNRFTEAFPLVYSNSAFNFEHRYSKLDYADCEQFNALAEKQKALQKELSEINKQLLDMQ